MPPVRQVYSASTLLLSALIALIGVVMLISTLVRGGGPLSQGFLVGGLFLAAGIGRITIARRK